MKFAGFLIMAAYMPYLAYADSAAAAAAAAAEDGYSSAAAAAAAAAYNGCGSAAAAAAAASGDDAAAAAAAAAADDNSAAAAAAAASDNGAAAAAASSASGGDSGTPGYTINCNCNDIYRPVCGTDGYTYSNECILRCVDDYNCQSRGQRVGILYPGECERPYQCPQVYEPICGANNKTYSNECYLAAENDVRERNKYPSIPIAYYGACQSTSCVCPDTIIPVCGTNGKTYRNICVLQCNSRIEQSRGGDPIYLQESNACTKERCCCTDQKNELCANDGKTYPNDCVLDCQNRRLRELGEELLTVRYRGKCMSSGCPKNYEPVCANNDQTFGNYCLFEHENDERRASGRPLLFARWAGRCDCGCNRNYKPVCATNGRVYQSFRNLCVLSCLNRKLYQDRKRQFYVIRRGLC